MDLLSLLATAVALTCAPALEISVASGTLQRIALGPQAVFSVTYWHSMYDVPFTEDYRVDAAGKIRLEDLRSENQTVLDYYSLEGTPGEVRALNRHFDSLAFGIAMGKPQILTVGDRQWSLREFGSPGARVAITPIADCDRR